MLIFISIEPLFMTAITLQTQPNRASWKKRIFCANFYAGSAKSCQTGLHSLVFKFLIWSRHGNTGDASIILEWFVCTKTLTPLCRWEILVLELYIGTLVYDYYYKLRSWNIVTQSDSHPATAPAPVQLQSTDQPSKECLGQQARSAWWIAAPHSGREGGGGGMFLGSWQESALTTLNFKLRHNPWYIGPPPYYGMK